MSEDAPLGTFEEQVMLAVLRTGEEAYGMAVRRELARVTGRDVAIGAVYATLDRLEAKSLLGSLRKPPLASSPGDRGAGSRRVFSVTDRGIGALAHSRAMRERLWSGVQLEGLTAEG